jgi:predicted Zn-dependent peptidase
VIGQRRVIERCTREQLAEHVQRHYGGVNIVVAAAGGIDATAVQRATEAAFGDLPPGQPNALLPAPYSGGIRVKRMDVGQQTHLVLGGPVPARGDDATGDLAAAVLGEGMSSPLLSELREKRGLVYHAACNAERFEFGGQFAIEASFASEHVHTVLAQVLALLKQQAADVGTVDLERARNQTLVRLLGHGEYASRRLEEAALDLFALGRVRSTAERIEQVQAVSREQVRNAFERLLHGGLSAAITGNVARGTRQRAQALLQASA